MARIGFAIEDQRESSSFRFNEGRGVIVSLVARRGGSEFNKEKLCIVVGLQRLGSDGKPTDDDVVYEELGYGPMSTSDGRVKFHPGNRQNPDDAGTDLG
jgi:hypothetical protein